MRWPFSRQRRSRGAAVGSPVPHAEHPRPRRDWARVPPLDTTVWLWPPALCPVLTLPRLASTRSLLRPLVALRHRPGRRRAADVVGGVEDEAPGEAVAAGRVEGLLTVNDSIVLPAPESPLEAFDQVSGEDPAATAPETPRRVLPGRVRHSAREATRTLLTTVTASTVGEPVEPSVPFRSVSAGDRLVAEYAARFNGLDAGGMAALIGMSSTAAEPPAVPSAPPRAADAPPRAVEQRSHAYPPRASLAQSRRRRLSAETAAMGSQSPPEPDPAGEAAEPAPDPAGETVLPHGSGPVTAPTDTTPIGTVLAADPVQEGTAVEQAATSPAAPPEQHTLTPPPAPPERGRASRGETSRPVPATGRPAGGPAASPPNGRHRVDPRAAPLPTQLSVPVHRPPPDGTARDERDRAAPPGGDVQEAHLVSPFRAAPPELTAPAGSRGVPQGPPAAAPRAPSPTDHPDGTRHPSATGGPPVLPQRADEASEPRTAGDGPTYRTSLNVLGPQRRTPARASAAQASAGRVETLEHTEERVPPDLAAGFRQTYGVEVGSVPVHRGRAVDGAARTLGARAFTRGTEVYLPDEAGELTTTPARALLAHELTHVAQRRLFGPEPPRPGSPAARGLEAAAAAVERVFAGQAPTPLRPEQEPLSLPALSLPRTAPSQAAPQATAPPAAHQVAPWESPMLAPAGASTLPPAAASPARDAPAGAPPRQSWSITDLPGGAEAFPELARTERREGRSTRPAAAPSPPSTPEPELRADLTRLEKDVAELRKKAEQPGTDWTDQRHLGELAAKLYPNLRTRLRSELLIDRERSGTLADRR